MSLQPFTPEFNESAIPLPTEVVKILDDHCVRMLKASDHDMQTRPFTTLLSKFDPTFDTKHAWIPDYLEPLYGSQWHKTLNDEQRLALNHMGWVAHYGYAVLGELMTLKYNEYCADIFEAHGYDTIGKYLRRESDEERTHIKTFSHIAEVIEGKYLGRPMIRFRLAQGYNLPESGFKDFAPWKVTAFYYWLRGHQNIALRVREQDMQRVETPASTVKITTAHFDDETRHYATSHVVAETMAEMDEGLPNELRMNYISKLSFNGPQAGANWIWPTVQGTPSLLINETGKLLEHPIFGLSKADIIEVMESVYTQRPENDRWEKMRSRAFRPTMGLNNKLAWIPSDLKNEDKVHDTMKFNLDKGLVFARKAFGDWKARYEQGIEDLVPAA